MFCLKDQTILVTRASSFRKLCAEYLHKHANLKRLIAFNCDEQKHVNLRRNHVPQERYPETRYFVGDVPAATRPRRAFQDVGYDIHAAAIKHVDEAGCNPQEFGDNNAHWPTVDQIRSLTQESDQSVLDWSQPVTLAA